MSYFAQDNYQSDTYDYVLTPEMADIYAVQAIYGSQTTRTGNTTYGFNSTAGSFYNFSTYSGTPAFTIYDTGGNDTFDASGYFSNQTIDLTPGDWSSIGGYTDNIGIYLTTTIENAIGGSGNDIIYGNDANNNLYLTEVGSMAVGIIPPDTRQYRTYVSDPNMVWPDGVSYNSDGYMYVGAAQLIQTGTFQDNATPKGKANNAAPYRIFRFRPEAAGTPGS